MHTRFLFLALLTAFFAGCSSSYKTIQTPDDVYFSTERPVSDEYYQVRNQNRRHYTADEYYEDRLLRMKVANRNRWSDLDDWYYYNNRYAGYSFNNRWNNPWNTYSYWNYAYNPYCPSTITYNVKTATTPNKPRIFNLNGFTDAQAQNNNSNSKVPGINTNNWYYKSNSNNNSNSYQPYNNYNSSNRNDGNFLRNVFNTIGNGTGRSDNSNFGNSGSTNSSSSGSSKSSSGSTAPVRKFDN